jgi:N-acylneuraminate cytidylyltransferase/CMP-N,N'-diacetyllegionaminic acid synthase
MNRVLMIIPARGGSKRLPNKNKLLLAGKPLIAWTIEVAINSKLADRILVSSDDDDILSIANSYGISIHERPYSLATDTAKSIDTVKNIIENEERNQNFYENIILLQPTSPLRDASDVLGAYDLFLSKHGFSVVSVAKVEFPFNWCGTINDHGIFNAPGLLHPAQNRANEQLYRLNGSIYITTAEFIKREGKLYGKHTLAYIMSPENSVDIDNQIDLLLCEAILSMRNGLQKFR